MVGLAVGFELGRLVLGDFVGEVDGDEEGLAVGIADGDLDGDADGIELGRFVVGEQLGDAVGCADGLAVASARERRHKTNAKGSSNTKLMVIRRLKSRISLTEIKRQYLNHF